MGGGKPSTEQELIRKLLTEFHLNVPERRSLLGGRARFSVIHQVVSAALSDSPWFPSPIPDDGIIGDGGVLELRGPDIWLHEQHECGMGQFGPIKARRMSGIEEAIREYITVNAPQGWFGEVGGGPAIDGVEIDWDS